MHVVRWPLFQCLLGLQALPHDSQSNVERIRSAECNLELKWTQWNLFNMHPLQWQACQVFDSTSMEAPVLTASFNRCSFQPACWLICAFSILSCAPSQNYSCADDTPGSRTHNARPPWGGQRIILLSSFHRQQVGQRYNVHPCWYLETFRVWLLMWLG